MSAMVDTAIFKVHKKMKLPDERKSIVHKFEVGGFEGYLIVGLYPEGTPGEVFIVISKEGSFVGGLMDSWAQLFSISLQWGTPLEVIVKNLRGQSYESGGYTSNPEIPEADSITDYVLRWMERKWIDNGIKP